MVRWAPASHQTPTSKEILIGPRLILIAAIGTLLASAPVAAAARQEAGPAERLAVLVNQARIAQGLNPVAISAELTAAAVAHTRDMVERSYMDHAGLRGSTPQQRAVQHGYLVPAGTAWIVVEVISARATAEAAANWLLSDPTHRRVVLGKNWREMGVAYVQGGPYGQFWTIDFGCRPNVLPVIAETTPAGTTLRLTNEECAPSGGTAEQMGRATEVMLSDRPDFEGGRWEPFVATRAVGSKAGPVYVKLRDGRGREALAVAGAGSPTATTAPLSAATATDAVAIPATPAATPPAPSADESAPPSGLFDPGPAILSR